MTETISYDMQDSKIFLTKEEKEKIKSVFVDEDLIEDDEITILKKLRNESLADSIKLGKLYLNCYSILSNNLHLFEVNNLKKILNEFYAEELRNLFEDYGKGEEWGSHNASEKIKDLIKLNRNKLNKIINLFFEVSEND